MAGDGAGMVAGKGQVIRGLVGLCKKLRLSPQGTREPWQVLSERGRGQICALCRPLWLPRGGDLGERGRLGGDLGEPGLKGELWEWGGGGQKYLGGRKISGVSDVPLSGRGRTYEDPSWGNFSICSEERVSYSFCAGDQPHLQVVMGTWRQRHLGVA